MLRSTLSRRRDVDTGTQSARSESTYVTLCVPMIACWDSSSSESDSCGSDCLSRTRFFFFATA